jgi:hypothetical protein
VATGVRNGSLLIADNSNGVVGSSQSVALTGTGVAPAPAATPSAATVNFGTNNRGIFGLLGVSRTIAIRSTGNAPLVIGAGAVSILGVDANNFSVTANGCNNVSLAPGGSCNITVRFRARGAAGAKNATLRVVSNGVNSPTNVGLTGTAT